jgi:hypothetical protein
MRAAQYMDGEKAWDPIQDSSRYFNHLTNVNLGPMNDPKSLSKGFYAHSSTAKGTGASSKLATATTRANKVLAHMAYKPNDAFYYLD